MKKKARKKKWESPKILLHELNLKKLNAAHMADPRCTPESCVSPGGPTICPE